MLSTRTARIVGIDFGHAFGSALTHLPVPELVPFRLTRQLTTAMGAIGAQTRFESALAQCMRVMRADRQCIVDALRVFVREPSIDWCPINAPVASLSAINASSSLSSSLAKSIDYARKKVSIAERKLNGDHPIAIVCTELREKYVGNNRSSAIDTICANVFANIASSTDKSLSVIDQIRLLISIASDDAVLARVFCGWEPWL
jgi:DNA-dependent protein kinase catalytic subunit